jgi:hypothetical protein
MGQTFPVRGLSKYGVLTDPDPYDLPTEAFSFGVNVRFRAGRVTRGPVFRNAHALSTGSPRFVCAANPTTGLDLVFLGYLNGRVFNYANGTETDYSPVGYVNSNAEAQWTSCHLADIVYLNRPDRVPWYFTQTATAFATLPNWDSTWRANLLRSYAGCLVAFNVTKGATNFPTMVKTSDFPLSGTVPASWNETIETLNTTENILAEMEGPIVDAQTLRNLMIIYGNNETWLMQFTGGQEVFDYQRLFYNRGAINANCAVEVNGKHYVFGTDDIWTHDGNSEASIAYGRVREFIFGTMNQSLSYRCFVAHDAVRKEVQFCYVSSDAHVAFLNANACNRAAVYNYQDNTWSFDDLPLVYFGDRANLNTVQTYTTTTLTYDTAGGAYLDQDDSFKRTLVFVGDVSTTYSLTASLYAFDWHGPGSTVAFPVDVHATAGMYLERTGIDLDAVGVDLVGYKLLSSIIPQGRFETSPPPVNLSFSVGAADYFNQTPVYSAPQTYDGSSNYKLDFNITGRYLAMQINYPDFNYASLSGFDFELDVLGER